MTDNVPDAQRARHLHRGVRGVVIHQDHLIHDVHRDLPVRPFQRQSRIVRRQHHTNLLAFQHFPSIRKKTGKDTKKWDISKIITPNEHFCIFAGRIPVNGERRTLYPAPFTLNLFTLNPEPFKLLT